MLQFKGKLLQFSSIKDPATKPKIHLLLLRKSVSNPSFSNTSTSCTTEQPSFTVSYLMNSCGLSPESALTASKKVELKNHVKPDSVLTLLQEHGFSKTHITKLITRLPSLLQSDSERTIKPKIDFFVKSGISGSVMVKMLSSDPSIFRRSLTNQIIPSFDFLRSFLHTNESINAALRCSAQVLQANLQEKLAPNISILQDHGVPESRISALIMTHPRALTLMPVRFSEIVKTVEGIGFDRSSSTFIIAVRVVSVMSRSTWEGKLEVYRRLGLSEDEILMAFRKQPMCMLSSEKKIKRTVEFIANELGIKASSICQYPNVLLLSFEKRIVPRCSVIRVLMSRNLVKKDLSLITALGCSESDFLRKFVRKYQEEVPEVLTMYTGKRGFLGSEIGSEEAGEAVML